MPVSPENIHKVTSLLKQYGVDSQEIDVGLKLDEKLENWKQYIKENIPPSKKQQFGQQLSRIFSGVIESSQSVKLENPQERLRSDLQNAYSKISPQPINIQRLVSIPLSQSKWSDQLMIEVQNSLKSQINKAFSQTTTIEQFLKFFSYRIYDLIARKVDLASFFNLLQNISSNYGTSAAKMISKLHFNDFIIFFLKYVEEKEIIGKLLGQIGIAVPLFYTYDGNLQYYAELLKGILSTSSYHLILNLGTPATKSCGKSKLLSGMFALNKKNSSESHFSNLFNIYTGFAFGIKQKAIIADFNGYIDSHSGNQLKQKLLQVGLLASLVIFHVHQTEVGQDNSITFFNNPPYSNILSSAEKVILFIRDLNNVVQKRIVKALPQKFKDKTVIYLLPNMNVEEPNFLKKTSQITDYLLSKGVNDLKTKKFRYQLISSDEFRKKVQKYKNVVDEVIKMVQDKNYKKQHNLPAVTCFEKLCQKKQQLQKITIGSYQCLQKFYDQYDLIKGEISSLQSFKKTIKFSKFSEKGIAILEQKQKDCNQILIESLTEWKNAKLFPLKNKYIELTNRLHQKKYKKDYNFERNIIMKSQKLLKK